MQGQNIYNKNGNFEMPLDEVNEKYKRKFTAIFLSLKISLGEIVQGPGRGDSKDINITPN